MDVQHLVSRIEASIKTMAAQQRSHCLRLKGGKFDALIPEQTSQVLRDAAWRAFCSSESRIKHDVTVLRGASRSYPEEDDRIVFLTRRVIGDREKCVQTFIKAEQASAVLTLYETDPIEWLLHGEMTARQLAERAAFYSVSTCTIVLVPYDPTREVAIRDALAECLERQGSTEARRQAESACIVGLSSLADVEDVARWHLLIDGVHDLGTEKHAEWVYWAQPLREKGVLRTIDLFGASDLLPAASGFATAVHLSPRPRHAELLQNLAMQMLVTFFEPQQHLLSRRERDVGMSMTSVIKRNGHAVVVSRLSRGSERRANEAWLQSYPSAHVKHAALLADLAAVMQQPREQNTPVFLRDAVAQAMTLQDWVTFLVATRRRIIVLFGQDQNQTLQIEDYIRWARFAYPPLLAGDV